jgi:heme O synthase-like polyprenyltransferase
MIKLALTKTFVTKPYPILSILKSDKILPQTYVNYNAIISNKAMLGGTYNKYNINTEKIKSRANAYWRLCRGHQPIGALLLYWPTAWGVCIGSPGLANMYYLLLFLMGSWTSRSAGCIVNDYFDR